MKIGAITVGQSPREDVMADLVRIFGDKVQVEQRGCLDGLTLEQISTFKPDETDYVLVSRLKDGTSVTFAEKYILPIIQEKIDELESLGVALILFFCTGQFPDLFKANVPLIYPSELLRQIVPLLSKKSNIITVAPSTLQIHQNESTWQDYVKEVKAVAISPYEEGEIADDLIKEMKKSDADLIVLDCIGFSQKLKTFLRKETGKFVILPRTLVARNIMELVDMI